MCSLVVEEIQHVYNDMSHVVQCVCREAAGRVVVWGGDLGDDDVAGLKLGGAAAVVHCGRDVSHVAGSLGDGVENCGEGLTSGDNCAMFGIGGR